MVRFALLAVCTAAMPLCAQVDGRVLRTGTDSLAVFVVRGRDTIRTGTIVDELAVVQAGATSHLRRVYRTRDRVLGMRLDTLVDDLSTLRPVSLRSRTDRAFEFLSFAPGRVTGWLRIANGDSVGVDVQSLPEVYSSSTVDLVIRASPLSDGWQMEVAMFLPNTRGTAPFRARVTGSDSVGGSEAWRVEAEFTGTPVTFWVDKTTRHLVKQEMRVRRDMIILFTRISSPATRRAA
jgi:hypothetical protein